VGDDRAVAETWVMGERAYARDASGGVAGSTRGAP